MSLKEVFCVKQSTKPRDAGLDCYLSHDAPFSADKLRTQYERFYMSVVRFPVHSLAMLTLASSSNYSPD